jgi:phage shock protein E
MSVKTIIDVRTPQEFEGGNVAGSINIPLQEINLHIDQIKKLPQPIVLCCASGGRSSMATSFLLNQGIPCENAGSWFNLL